MNSSVKSLVPSVSVPPDPPDDALVLLVELAAVVGDAPAADELELLLLPQAATTSAAMIVSIAAASICVRRDLWRAAWRSVACLLIRLFLLLVKQLLRCPSWARRPLRLATSVPTFAAGTA